MSYGIFKKMVKAKPGENPRLNDHFKDAGLARALVANDDDPG